MKNKHIYYLLLPLVVVFNLVITGCESRKNLAMQAVEETVVFNFA